MSASGPDRAAGASTSGVPAPATPDTGGSSLGAPPAPVAPGIPSAAPAGAHGGSSLSGTAPSPGGGGLPSGGSAPAPAPAPALTPDPALFPDDTARKRSLMEEIRTETESSLSNTLRGLIWERDWPTLEERIGTEEGRIRARVHDEFFARLPLHWACRYGAPPGVVRALLDAWGLGARHTDKYGSLPLHEACENAASPEVVMMVLAAFPEGAKSTNQKGKLPLHYACENVSDPEAVCQLVGTYPEGASKIDKDAKLPLHYACEKNVAPEVVQALVGAHGNGVSKRDRDGKLPIQLAFENGAPTDVLCMLHLAYPEGMRMQCNQWGKLPLHIACEQGSSSHILQALVMYPEGARKACTFGKIPLHYACEKGADHEVVRALIKAHGEGVSKVDKKGRLPFHHASAHGASLEVIELLLNKQPDGARTPDECGRLPLHYECSNAASLDTVQALLLVFPGGASKVDEDGKLPLHSACENDAPPEVVRALLDLYPAGASTSNWFGTVPLHHACEHNSNPEIVKMLLEKNSEVVRQPLNSGLLPLHLACENCSSPETVQLLLDMYPEATRKADNSGRLPLHYACENGACAEVVEKLLIEFSPGLSVANRNGRNPLHLACEKGCSTQLLEKLVQAHPKAAAMPDARGDLPVHILFRKTTDLTTMTVEKGGVKKNTDLTDNTSGICHSEDHQSERGSCDEVLSSVELLLRAAMMDRNACTCRGRHGVFLPLHIASWCNVSLSVFEHLVSTYPQAASRLSVNPPDGLEQYALDLLENCRTMNSSMNDWRDDFNLKGDLLFAFYPDIAPGRGQTERLGRLERRIIHESKDGKLSDVARRVWIWLCESDYHEDSVSKILQGVDSKASKDLAFVKMRTGQPVLVGASPSCGHMLRSKLLFVGRYNIARHERPLHQSRTCIVLRAKDYGSAAYSMEGDLDLISSDTGAPVVIKLMHDKDQFKKEKSARSGLQLVDGKFPAVVPCISDYDCDRVESAEEKIGDDGDRRFQADLEDLAETEEFSAFNLKKYHHALVMPEADRTLEEIFRHERPTLNEIRGIGEQVGKALQVLHENHIVHCDLKSMNIVRLNGRMCLIDMDASTRTKDHKDFNELNDFAGTKFSSGVLPPEMIVELNKESMLAYEKYWTGIEPDHWKKLKPVLDANDGAGYVVKSFKDTVEDLPYKPIRASEKIDVWSFGVLMFVLCSDEPFLPVTRDDDLFSARDFSFLLKWEKEKAQRFITAAVTDALAQNLLSKLLAPSESRLTALSQVLKEPFFEFDASPAEKNRIAVLFSDPLVWADADGFHPVAPRLNYKRERTLLIKCIYNSQQDIMLSFYAATCDRLQSLANAQCECLHFSGHGIPDSYLLFEDGTGGAHFLGVDGLCELIPHQEPFKLVFVSACHSEIIGNAFVAAGVKHVVCCEQKSQINHEASAQFTASFYGALVSGETVKLAFASAKGAVSARYGSEEAKKIRLLPQSQGHDICIFDSARSNIQKESEDECALFPSKLLFPAPPQHFLGREVAMYNILHGILSEEQLITIVGEEGIGRSSLARALCHYVNERIDDALDVDVIYFVQRNGNTADANKSLLMPLYRQLTGDKKAIHIDNIMNPICDSLSQTKSLLIFDGVDGLEETLCDCLLVLLERISEVKIILTARTPIGLASSAVVERVFHLKALAVESATELFARTCDFADTDSERSNLIEKVLALQSFAEWPEEIESSQSLSVTLQEGMPSNIIKAAKQIPEEDYVNLVQCRVE